MNNTRQAVYFFWQRRNTLYNLGQLPFEKGSPPPPHADGALFLQIVGCRKAFGRITDARRRSRRRRRLVTRPAAGG